MFTSPDTIIPDPYNSLDYNRYSYVRYNPIRYNDPSGHMCSDPDDPTPSCEGGTRRNEGGGIGNPKKMHEYQKRERPELSKELLEKIIGLTGGDDELYNLWLNLYSTETGYDLALWIVQREVQISWGDIFGSHTSDGCQQPNAGPCQIFIDTDYKGLPSDFADTDPQLRLSGGTIALAEEAFHAVLGGYNNSLFEEYVAKIWADAVRIDLQGSGQPYAGDIYDFYITPLNSETLTYWFQTSGLSYYLNDRRLPAFPYNGYP